MVIKGMDPALGGSEKSPIYFVSGDKGGVGKSICARAVCSHFIACGHEVVGFDGDARNGHLDRHLARHMNVHRMALRSFDEMAEMLNFWEEIPSDQAIVIDLPGNIGDTVAKQTDRIHRVADAIGRGLRQIWVASEEEDSIWLLQDALKFVDAKHTVFVRNERFGSSSEDFCLWHESNTRREFIDNGGVEGRLPLLRIRPRAAISKHRLSFANVEPAQLLVAEKIDFDMWWSVTQTEINRWLNLMGDR